MKTSSNFINEYSFCDEVMEVLESAEKDITTALYKYNSKVRQLELNSIFAESEANYNVMLEAENEGLLATIGNAALKIIETISNFIKEFTAKITGNTKTAKSVSETVNKMVIEHPELKDQIIKGIDKEWYTMRDVAAFEKDIIGLTNMLKKQAIDHMTFKEKVFAKCKSFSETAAPIITTGAKISTIIGLPLILCKQATESKKSLTSMRDTFKTVSNEFNKNREYYGADTIGAFTNAYGKAMGLVAKECSAVDTKQSTLCKFLSKVTLGAIDIKRTPREEAEFIAKRDKSRAEWLKKEAIKKKKENDYKKDEEDAKVKIDNILRSMR